MDFAFTEEQLLVQKTFRQFALEKVLPNAPRWDRGEPITKEVIKEVAALGVLALRIPEQFGGQEADYVTCGLMTEELSRGDFNIQKRRQWPNGWDRKSPPMPSTPVSSSTGIMAIIGIRR